LIIGNPPFIGKKDFSISLRENLIRLSKNLEYDPKQLKNAWAAFVLASHELLTPSGVLAFIVPFELLTVSYGKFLQKSVFHRFERVDIFVPDDKVFRDLDQDVVVLLAQKTSIEPQGTFVHRISSFRDMSPNITRRLEPISGRDHSIDLKSYLLNLDTLELLYKLRESSKIIGDFLQCSPGLVTAANDYFILPIQEAKRLGLMKWSYPVLKKGSSMSKCPVFSNNDFRDLVQANAPTQFIHLPGSDLDNFTTEVKDYIRFGEASGIDQRFKCRNRTYWHEVPLVQRSEGFFFRRSHDLPRLCVNEAGVLTTDTAYQIRSNPDISIRGICYSFYNSLTLLFTEIDGRSYGGGVLELTPGEFRGLPISYYEPNDHQFGQFVSNHLNAKGNEDDIVLLGDEVLSSVLQLSYAEIECLKRARRTLRSYRTRHSTAAAA
jgi:adenine-specific DNA-methyltransferase